MKTKYFVWGVAAVVLVGAGWYAFTSHKGEEKGATIPTTTSTTDGLVGSSGTMYEAGNLLLGKDATTTLGTYLIGFTGRPVYQNADEYVKEHTNSINCLLECATTWRPYLVPDTSVLKNVQSGVKGSVGTVLRPDGSTQVTYNGKPLYFYKHDTETTGPTGNGAGGVWSIVKP